MQLINDIIQPETELESLIIQDSDFIAGALWGKPRNGHPEGQVIYHIGDVLKNVDSFSTKNDRSVLRSVAIIHDTFKYRVDKTKSKSGENHHAMIARRFAEKYISDTKILDIIELHDEAYNAYCVGSIKGKWDRAEARTKALVERLGDSLELYLTFYRCDNTTGDKNNDDFVWFNNIVDGRNKTK
jgi:hypothetical protein